MSSNRRKLIEVALPLPEINDASAYDKLPGIGPHPKGIHHWWARLPLPTARAVLFASVVDDPSSNPEKWPTEEAQTAERERLFEILRAMMTKRMHERPDVYARARAEMLLHADNELPAVVDPFAGGGSIPLEANRLGFETRAGDLNPVAVLLNKCTLELAPRWVACPPVNPDDRAGIGGTQGWRGTKGLAADVRYYGRTVRERAVRSVAHLYPRVQLPSKYGRGDADVIAWIWARTVRSPDPAARGAHVPLMSTFWLATGKGEETWVEPVVDANRSTYRFEIRSGKAGSRGAIVSGTKNKKGGFRCLLTGTPIPFEYIRDEGRGGRLGQVLVATVAQLARGRTYVAADQVHLDAANSANPRDYPDTDLPDEALGFRIQNYGIRKHWQMFTRRQLATLVALSDSVKAIGGDIERDATRAGLQAEQASTYADTVSTFLSLGLDRCVDFNNALTRWSASNHKVMNLFGRQAIPMIWDFAEANLLGDSVGSWHTCSEYVADCIEVVTAGSARVGTARQMDAAAGIPGANNLLISTDPPYYDNIGYAALSDVFYIWLRRTIGDRFPELFTTVLVPKIQELTAAPERFGGNKDDAKKHFETGFRQAFTALRDTMDSRYPLTVYYAFRQADEEGEKQDDESSPTLGIDLTTGWETLLEALIASGFQITATWPVRASQAWRMRAMSSNALASYIVLSCRRRPTDARSTDRRSFAAELKRELPAALRNLQQGNIAPVDFSQAAIGPGMAVYSRYASVLESSGQPMSVRPALALINRTLTEVLSEQEDDFDADTRWAIAWFEQFGFSEGEYGDANTLAMAKNTSVGGMQQAGILMAKASRVRLYRPEELPQNWDPARDTRLTMWEMTHHLLRIYYHEKAGDDATAALLQKLGSKGEIARELAYRLFDICERKKRAQEALAYNALVLGWPEVARLARTGSANLDQAQLFE